MEFERKFIADEDQTGPSDAHNVSLSDLLPSTETFVSQSQTNGSDAFTLSQSGNAISDTIATSPPDFHIRSASAPPSV